MRNACWALAAAVVLTGCGDDEQPLSPDLSARAMAAGARVTTSADAGPGSFRAALDLASQDPSISRITIADGISSIAPFAAEVLGSFGQPAAVTTESDVAETVWRAATDSTGQIRFPAGPDAVALARREGDLARAADML